MKTLVIFTLLAASAVMAGETVSVGGIEPPSEYNAHWQLIKDSPHAGVGCVRDDMYVYGSNDCASLIYKGTPINLAGYDGVRMSIGYIQETADDGDYCELYFGDEDHNYTLVHTFEDTDGSGNVMLMLDGYYGVRDLKIYFVWYSDETGVDVGFRVHSIEMYGANWGEGEYTNIFTWDSGDVTGHQTVGLDWMLLEGNMNCLAFEYGTDSDAQGWWAMDNVELTANGESVLPRQAGGYGIEDFESGGWYQDRHGLPGEWETDTDRVTGDMSGANWQSDSAANPGSPYQAETLSPWLDIGAANMITLFFDTWFHPGGTGEHASFGFYKTTGHLMWLEQFPNLDDWLTVDGGEDVVPTSWGAIKASF